jgi:hypothetical protein
MTEKHDDKNNNRIGERQQRGVLGKTSENHIADKNEDVFLFSSNVHYFCLNLLIMNLQSVLNPIASLFQGYFENLLVPSLSIMNTICILGGFFGLWLWLKRQKAYNVKAKQDGGIA